ncbi:4-hydroxyphenylpyruvate dioxygenase [Inhella gelatinilytica]|uniref:4-hydroxyphenylpyruvate dioxygenase n=1 Tax=Inhella gelatinilytica TaxID=2795030 RepID=A0A931IUH9_9BURK|nr:4-hydroxyphenylpyruvate dioxygenase [Inhella gelatinilytica]MBH9551234.1 4-hydroxyphenylpyruvate dioxygenase [Inhella gelatinilytica]
MSNPNPCGLRGIEFTEFCGPDLGYLESLFWAFGFSKVRRHAQKDITYFRQNDIHFLLNGEREGHSAAFAKAHGPSISAMAWRCDNGQEAVKAAVARGAVEVPADQKDHPYPAVWGIGGSVIYFIDVVQAGQPTIYDRDFVALEKPLVQAHKGFTVVDHLTNNVPPGEQDKWASFYKDIFGFTEVRYFDIKGVKTGLTSFALRSPDGSFCIPINQPKDDKDQIAEYLREYKGPGVQHLAFATTDILASLDALQGSPIDTLEIDDEYYDEVFNRVPGVREDHARIRAHQVLVDGDESGYLLQIFTKNIIGPIFIEIIQRQNNLGFGEGNFGALFRSLEKDQERRGVI